MRIPISCKNIDRLLGGGIETGCVTLFYGEAGAGKTNVCLQAARTVTSQGSRVAYIDTEGLSYERLGQVFEGREEDVKNLLIFQVHSLEEQTDRVEKVGKLAENKAVSMVIIDSLTMFYRLRYEDPKARSDLIKEIEMLQEMARKFDVAVVVTSQVYSNLNSGGVEFLGGHALKHNAKTIIRMEKLENGRRKAVIVKHRSLPEGRSVYYRITQTGIEDVRSQHVPVSCQNLQLPVRGHRRHPAFRTYQIESRINGGANACEHVGFGALKEHSHRIDRADQPASSADRVDIALHVPGCLGRQAVLSKGGQVSGYLHGVAAAVEGAERSRAGGTYYGPQVL